MNYPNSLRNGFRWLTAPYALLDEVLAQATVTVRMALPGMGNVLLTGDPVLMQAILTNPHLVGGKGIRLLRTLFGGESLITLHGAAHTARRRLLTPLFRPADLAALDDLTTETALAAFRAQPLGQPFSLAAVAREVTLRVILHFVFGPLPPATAALAQQLILAFTASFDNPWLLFLRPLHLDLGRHSPWGRAAHNRHQLRNFIRQQVRVPPRAAASVLAHLVQSSELTENEIVDEIFALLMFGHDSAAWAVAWAGAHIYSHPAVMARLRAAPTDLVFLEACLNESMRLCPVVVQLFRVAEQAVVVGEHRLRPGEIAMPSAYLAQHNPALFPAPYHFRPERFLDARHEPLAFFPYGLGTRLCLGKTLAQRQMLLMLAALVRDPTLALAPGYQPTPERQMVLIAPRAGTLLVRQVA